GIPESAATITSGMGHYVVRCAEGRDVGGRPGDRCLLSPPPARGIPYRSTVLISLVHGSAAATHRADQAGRAELNTSRYSAEAPITPCTAPAAAASPALAALRLAASACGSCHTVSLIKRPEAQSAYSSAAQKPLVSASKGTAVSPYQATA